MDRDAAGVRGLLSALRPKVEQCRESMKNKQVMQALLGVLRLGDTPEARAMVGAFSPVVSPAILGGEAACQLLKACDNLTNSPEALGLLEALAAVLEKPLAWPGGMRGGIAGWHVANAMLGLQRFEDAPEVRRLLSAMRHRLREEKRPLNWQNLENALAGLHSLGDSPELRGFLSALAPKVYACQEELKSKALVAMLRGLRNVGDCPEHRNLLDAFTPRVKTSRGIRAKFLMHLLRGLGALEASPEARGFVSALTKQVETCVDILSPEVVCLGLLGLQNLGDSPEVRELLSALWLKVEAANEGPPPRETPLQYRFLFMALYGLRGVGDCAERFALVEVLTWRSVCGPFCIAEHDDDLSTDMTLPEWASEALEKSVEQGKAAENSEPVSQYVLQ